MAAATRTKALASCSAVLSCGSAALAPGPMAPSATATSRLTQTSLDLPRTSASAGAPSAAAAPMRPSAQAIMTCAYHSLVGKASARAGTAARASGPMVPSTRATDQRTTMCFSASAAISSGRASCICGASASNALAAPSLPYRV